MLQCRPCFQPKQLSLDICALRFQLTTAGTAAAVRAIYSDKRLHLCGTAKYVNVQGPVHQPANSVRTSVKLELRTANRSRISTSACTCRSYLSDTARLQVAGQTVGSSLQVLNTQRNSGRPAEYVFHKNCTYVTCSAVSNIKHTAAATAGFNCETGCGTLAVTTGRRVPQLYVCTQDRAQVHGARQCATTDDARRSYMQECT